MKFWYYALKAKFLPPLYKNKYFNLGLIGIFKLFMFIFFEYFGLIPKISCEKLEDFESNLKLRGHLPKNHTIVLKTVEIHQKL